MDGPAPRGPSPQARALLAGCPAARRWTVVGLVATVVASVLLFAWLLLLASVIDRVFLDGAALGDVGSALVAMVALLVARGLCAWAGVLAAQRASEALRHDVRRRLGGALVSSDPRRLGGARVGEVSGTLVGGVEDLGVWLTDYVPALVAAVTVPVLVFALVAVLDPLTTLILLFAGPMLVMLLALIGRGTAELARRRFEELGWLRGFYLDMIRGLGTLKSFGRSQDGARTIEATSRRFGDTTMEVLRTAFQTSLVIEWAATAATALAAVVVSFRLVGGGLTYGTALAVLVVVPEFFVPFRRLAVEYHAGQSGEAAAESIRDATAAPRARGRDVPARTGPSATSTGAPRIGMRDVTYTYPGSERPALRGLDLEVDAGTTVALVGPSGAGKSTVASLLLRFDDPDAGRITVDGRDLLLDDAAEWRRRVSWVPQRPTLFSGSVAENIALGDPGAPRERIVAAAVDAGASTFIEELEHGYDTVLGHGGSSHRGGQRQRIAIARAFLRDAPLVVLDEYTAHLDPEVEAEVLAAARRLLDGRTALVIAHRVGTARAADRIAVLEAGRVVEAGADDELFDSGGRWAAIRSDGEIGPRPSAGPGAVVVGQDARTS